jgi:uncharacterized membrane protein YkoI
MHISRKQIYSALAGVGIAIGAAGLASAATGSSSSPVSASPATATASSAQDPTDANGGVGADEAKETEDASETNDANEADGANDPNDSAQLAGRATITTDEAQRAALSARPGTVSGVQLEDENGTVVYGVIVDTGTGPVDVKVDANSGAVLSTEADTD